MTREVAAGPGTTDADIEHLARASEPRPTSRPRAIVVLGMHRSGTSAMTGVLALSGAHPPAPLMEPQPDNPLGYWEPAEMVALDEAVLDAAGVRWNDAFMLEDGPPAIEPHFLERACAFISRGLGAQGPLVLKDPRASLLTRFWRDAIEAAGLEPFFVLMVRHPLEIAASLGVRNALSRETAVLLWASHLLAAERGTRDTDRIFVSYDALLADWRDVLARIETRLGAPLPRRTPEAAVAVDAFLSGGHRHHRVAPQDPAAWSGLWPGWRALYRRLEAAACGESPGDDALETAAAQLRTLRAILGPVVADLQRERAVRSDEAMQAEVALRHRDAASHAAAIASLRQERDASWSREQIASLQIRSQQQQLATLTQAVEEARRKADGLEANIRTLKAGLSWRLTEPLRSLARRLRRP